MHILIESFYIVSGFLFIILSAVTIHEFGHYLFAKKFGVKIEAFSIGFGKELFGFNDKSGTRWKICILPLGGYVKMYGDADATSSISENINKFSKDELKNTYFYLSNYKKILIAFAGPLFNYTSAILIFTFLIFTYGKPYNSAIIEKVEENSPAYETGLISGDIIKNIDGNKVDDFEDIVNFFIINTKDTLNITIDRDGDIIDFVIKPAFRDLKTKLGTQKISYIGVHSSKTQLKEFSLIAALKESVSQSYEISKSTLISIGQIITNERDTSSLGGPVRIAVFSGEAAKNGIKSLLYSLAMISVLLGLFNLLPIPVLDGGHILIHGIEMLIGREIPSVIKKNIFMIGFLIILSVMLLALFNDIKFLDLF